MAQKMIEDTNAAVDSKRSKRCVGAPIFTFPSDKDAHFVVCLATGLVAPGMFFMDRAENSWPVVSPFIGALFLHNIRSLSHSDDSADRDLAEKFAPGAAARMLQSMYSRITANDTASGRIVINPSKRDAAAAVIKGKTGPQRKFTDALKTALENAPLRFRSDKSAPFLPASYAFHCGFTSAEIAAELAALIQYAQDFEKHWGWHGKDILRDANFVYEKRKDKRNAKRPTYTIERTDVHGNVIDSRTFEDFLEARKYFKSSQTPQASMGNNWNSILQDNYKKIEKGEEIREPQEEEARAGTAVVRIFRSKETLKDAFQKMCDAKTAASSSTSSLSDDSE